MPLDTLNLDDHSFDQLAAEARALIPRVMPEWTDHNPSDPGVTLVELFAFLFEAANYQLSRTPERTLRNFAALVVGAKPAPTEPLEQAQRRAMAALVETGRAILPGDFEFLAARGVFTVQPPLLNAFPRSAAVVMMDQFQDPARLARTAAQGAQVVDLSGETTVHGGDVIMLEGDGSEFARVLTVQPQTVTTRLNLQSALRFRHTPARTTIVRLIGPLTDTTTTLFAPVAAGSELVSLVPRGTLRTTGVLRLSASGVEEFVLGRGIARAAAIVETVPAATVYPDDRIVRLVVVPNRPDDPAPQPSADERQAVFDVLRSRSLITTRLQVVSPRYVPLSLDVTIVRDVSSLLRPDTVQGLVRTRLQEFFSPLVGGTQQTGWQFGRSVFRSEVYQVLEGLTGVDHVRRLALNGSDSINEVSLSPAGAPAQASASLVQLREPVISIVDGGPGG